MEKIEELFKEIHKIEKEFLINKLEIAKKEKIFKNIQYIKHIRFIDKPDDNPESYIINVNFKFDDYKFLNILNDIHYEFGVPFYSFQCEIYDSSSGDNTTIYSSRINENKILPISETFISETFCDNFIKPIIKMLVNSMSCEYCHLSDPFS